MCVCVCVYIYIYKVKEFCFEIIAPVLLFLSQGAYQCSPASAFQECTAMLKENIDRLASSSSLLQGFFHLFFPNPLLTTLGST